ncbi:hypothetical protein MMC30_006975 [Trapelia coarctata]|nr:hypothetical protein [Trapelia coarctata]
MSTSGTGGTGGDRPQGFSRFMRRASKVLKGSSTRASIASASDLAPTQSASTPSPSGPPRTQPSQPAMPQLKKPTAQPTELAVTSTPITSATAYNKLQEEKARALFAKWGLTLEPGEWTPVWKGDAGRVEKTVRMRTHRQCHRCQVAFGNEKVCSNCAHTRCKKCPRFPTKTPKEPQTQPKTVTAQPISSVAVDTTPYPGPRTKAKLLVMPEVPTGNEVVRKTPVHRVRRTCHKCETTFIGKATECTNCKHLRCPKCPREPPKPNKYPHGYPGDVPETFPLAERKLRPIRHRTRYTCHACTRVFLDHERICAECRHERCADCPRQPPKKVRPEVREDVLASLAEKLGAVRVDV